MDQLLNLDAPSDALNEEVLIWWKTLATDEQELLQVTYEILPKDDHLLAFLSWTDCPLIVFTGQPDRPFVLTKTEQLRTFLATTGRRAYALDVDVDPCRNATTLPSDTIQSFALGGELRSPFRVAHRTNFDELFNSAEGAIASPGANPLRTSRFELLP